MEDWMEKQIWPIVHLMDENGDILQFDEFKTWYDSKLMEIIAWLAKIQSYVEFRCRFALGTVSFSDFPTPKSDSGSVFPT